MTATSEVVVTPSVTNAPPHPVRHRSARRSGAVARWATVAALAVGVTRAVVGLGSRSLDYDEAFAARLAGGRWADLAQVGLTREPFAVLDAVLLRGWASVFGWSAISLRAMSVLAFAVTIVLVHLLAVRLSGRVAGAVAPLVLAVHGGALSDARSAAGGALATMVVAGAVLAIVAWLARPASPRRLLVAGVLAVLAGYATPYGAVVVVGVLVAALFLARESRTRVAALGGYVVLAWIPLGSYLVSGAATNSGWFSAAALQGYVGSRSTGSLLGSMNFWVAAVVLLLAAIVVVAWARRRALEEWTGTDVGVPLIATWALFPLAVGLVVTPVVPVLTPQLLTLSTPAVALLVGAAVQTVWAPRLAVLAALAAVAAMAWSNGPVVSTVRGPELDWRGVATGLASAAGSADVVVVQPSYDALPLAFAVDELGLQARMPAGLSSGSWAWRDVPVSSDATPTPRASYEWVVLASGTLRDLQIPDGLRVESTHDTGGVLLVHLIPA